MKKEYCEKCMWREGKICLATNCHIQTRYVRPNNCLNKAIKEASKGETK